MFWRDGRQERADGHGGQHQRVDGRGDQRDWPLVTAPAQTTTRLK